MENYGSVTYQGETYKTVVIGTQTWFQRNLNYAVEGSECFGDNPANCNRYGRLYNWATAMALPDNCNKEVCASQISAKHKGICPSGWHIPSKQDWSVLAHFASQLTYGPSNTWPGANRLKATSGWNSNDNGTDDYGFSALPGGSNSGGDPFFDCTTAGDSGCWWTTEEGRGYAEGYDPYYGTYGTNFEIFYDFDYINWEPDRKITLHSVRCVKD